MVHVLSEVLRKVWKSLRSGGLLLIIQPAVENPIVEVEIGGETAFREVKKEPNFRGYLRATLEAIHRSVGDGLFFLDNETISPEGDSYLCDEYDSVDDWEEDRLFFCEDFETFREMADRIQALVGGRKHRVFEYWKEYKVLLRKEGQQ